VPTQAVRQKIAELFEGESSECAQFFVGCVCLTRAAVRAGEQMISSIVIDRLLPLVIAVIRSSQFSVAPALAEFLQRSSRWLAPSVLATVIARLNSHTPAYDLASRTLNSSPKLLERWIASGMGRPVVRGLWSSLRAVHSGKRSGVRVTTSRSPRLRRRPLGTSHSQIRSSCRRHRRLRPQSTSSRHSASSTAQTGGPCPSRRPRRHSRTQGRRIAVAVAHAIADGDAAAAEIETL
jgi:hypothetical protein